MTKKAFTLFELLLVIAIVIILGASSAPFLARTVNWFYDVTKSDLAINDLYNTGIFVSRAVMRSSDLVASFTVSNDMLMFGNSIIQENVIATFTTVSELSGRPNLIKFEIFTTRQPIQKLNFLINPLK